MKTVKHIKHQSTPFKLKIWVYMCIDYVSETGTALA